MTFEVSEASQNQVRLELLTVTSCPCWRKPKAAVSPPIPGSPVLAKATSQGNFRERMQLTCSNNQYPKRSVMFRSLCHGGRRRGLSEATGICSIGRDGLEYRGL